jgi:hypothetical protein
LIDRRAASCETGSKIARQMAGSLTEEQLAGLTGRLLDRQADCYRQADRIPVTWAVRKTDEQIGRQTWKLIHPGRSTDGRAD